MSDDDLRAVPGDAANPPARKRALSGVEWLAAGLAIVGAGLTTLAVLTARSAPAGVTTAVTTAASGAAAQARGLDAMRAGSGPGWIGNDARWVGSARRSLAFEVPAVNKVSVWMREVQPLLVVRCMAGTIDVFVFTSSAAAIESQTEDHTVRYAFDEEAETRELWPDSSEHDALFAPDGAAFARRLMDVRAFRFGFTPHNAAPATAHFQVSGLRDRLAPAVKECGWKAR